MIYLKKGCKVWYFGIRNKGRRIQGSTHEAMAVEQALEMR